MRRFVLVMRPMPFGHGAFSFRHGAFCRRTGRGSVLADEIKSLTRPPTMTEVRDLAMKLYGRYAGRPVFELLKADWKKFGLDVVKGDTLAQKLIVPIEG